MADTNGNGNGPRWAWLAKTALGALGTVILVMLVDLRAGQVAIAAKADEAIRQGTAMRQELSTLAIEVEAQRVAVDSALVRLHYFRSDDDHDWQQIKERILRLEIRRERERPTRDGGIP